MLRWMTPFLVAICAAGSAAAQGNPVAQGNPAAHGTPIAPASDAPAAAKPADPPSAARPDNSPAAAGPGDNVAARSAAGPPVNKDPGKTPRARRTTVRAASQLPPGLPRAHYNYRTTVVSPAPPRYVRRGRALVVEEPEVDILTSISVVPFAPGVNGTPLLPGSSTLPGYYGTTHSYSYDGPYYGGPYEPFWNRLPYACGVYGYC